MMDARRAPRVRPSPRWLFAIVLGALIVSAAVLVAARYSGRRSTGGQNLPIRQIQLPTVLPDRTYSTDFPMTENPIDEAGNWLNGARDGLDWTDARSTAHKAFGTQPGNSTNPF